MYCRRVWGLGAVRAAGQFPSSATTVSSPRAPGNPADQLREFLLKPARPPARARARRPCPRARKTLARARARRARQPARGRARP